MKKSEVILELKRQGVVAVIRGESFEEGVNISKACIAGGLKAIEMAYTNSAASDIIKELCEMYKDDKKIAVLIPWFSTISCISDTNTPVRQTCAEPGSNITCK